MASAEGTVPEGAVVPGFHRCGSGCTGRTASGKVALYLKNGLPIVATTGSDLEWIERERCGVCVTSADEIPGAVTRVFGDYERLAANAVRCFDQTLDFARHFEPVAAAMARA